MFMDLKRGLLLYNGVTEGQEVRQKKITGISAALRKKGYEEVHNEQIRILPSLLTYLLTELSPS
jgi:hypothetical protein